MNKHQHDNLDRHKQMIDDTITYHKLLHEAADQNPQAKHGLHRIFTTLINFIAKRVKRDKSDDGSPNIHNVPSTESTS